LLYGKEIASWLVDVLTDQLPDLLYPHAESEESLPEPTNAQNDAGRTYTSPYELSEANKQDRPQEYYLRIVLSFPVEILNLEETAYAK